MLTELKNRGVDNVFIVSIDGLKGFPEAIATVFPDAQVQLCVVHQVRGSLNYVSWKHRKEVAADLKPIYRASTVEDAELRLTEFAAKWDKSYPTISQMWRHRSIFPLIEDRSYLLQSQPRRGNLTREPPAANIWARQLPSQPFPSAVR